MDNNKRISYKNENMMHVTSEEFYKVIGPLDVTLTLLGDYPYTTEFKLRHDGLIGLCKSEARYYLREDKFVINVK